MINYKINVEGEENCLEFSGDGEELLSYSLAMIAGFYNALLQQCPDCAQLYHDMMTDSTVLGDLFYDIRHNLIETDDCDGNCEECEFCCDEEEEQDDYEEPVKFISPLRIENSRQNATLFGFEDYRKKKRGMK